MFPKEQGRSASDFRLSYGIFTFKYTIFGGKGKLLSASLLQLAEALLDGVLPVYIQDDDLLSVHHIFGLLVSFQFLKEAGGKSFVPLLRKVYTVIGQGNVPLSGVGKANTHLFCQGLTEP